MQRGTRVSCSRPRTEARPHFTSGTTCRGVLGSPKRSLARQDQIYYAVRPSSGGKACGQTSFLDIQPEQGVIEIGSIWFGMTLRRTRSATESMYLMLRHAMDDLGYRRMQ